MQSLADLVSSEALPPAAGRGIRSEGRHYPNQSHARTRSTSRRAAGFWACLNPWSIHCTSLFGQSGKFALVLVTAVSVTGCMHSRGIENAW